MTLYTKEISISKLNTYRALIILNCLFQKYIAKLTGFHTPWEVQIFMCNFVSYENESSVR